MLQDPLLSASRETDPVILDGTAARLLDAAIACIARVGVSKSTLDEVAREAGCSRATLYRYFPGKPALLAALVARESTALERALGAASAEAGTLEDAIVAIVLETAAWLAAHPALSFVMTAETDVLLPHLAFDGADRVLRAGSRIIAPALERFFGAGESHRDERERAGEWLARMILSYVSSPAAVVDLADPISIRRLAADFLAPGLVTISELSKG